MDRIDGLLAAALGDPSKNLFGQWGPRCAACSGLGSVLRLTSGETTRHAARCTCEGSGLDLRHMERVRTDSLYARIDALEAQLIRRAKRAGMRSQITRTQGTMSRQYWSELIAWATADGTAVANTTTEAILFPNVTLPANYMQDGRVLRLKFSGQYGNVVTAVPTMTFAVRWGGVSGTVIATTAAIVTSATAMTAALWTAEVTIQTRSNGATGTVFVMGDLQLTTNTAPTFGTVTNYGVSTMFASAGLASPAAVTVDLTADTALSVTLDWSAANASNTATGKLYDIESKN